MENKRKQIETINILPIQTYIDHNSRYNDRRPERVHKSWLSFDEAEATAHGKETDQSDFCKHEYPLYSGTRQF